LSHGNWSRDNKYFTISFNRDNLNPCTIFNDQIIRIYFLSDTEECNQIFSFQ
jgi:hypothetical protein